MWARLRHLGARRSQLTTGAGGLFGGPVYYNSTLYSWGRRDSPARRMKFRDAILVAYRGLTRHWVRATLNVLGIVAGVASVIMLVSVAHAVSSTAKASVEGLGANLVVVYPSGASSSGIQLGLATTSTLTSNDATALDNRANVADGLQAVPSAGQSTNVSAGAHTWQTDVIGTTPGFQIARGYTVSQGIAFGTTAVFNGQAVVILGPTVAAQIFPNVDPIGQNVQINLHTFKVIGEYAPRGYSGLYNQDDVVVMPISALWSFVLPSNAPKIQQILVQASSPDTTANVATEVTNTLLRQHGACAGSCCGGATSGIPRSSITLSVSRASSFSVGRGPRIGIISRSTGHKIGIDQSTMSRVR